MKLKLLFSILLLSGLLVLAGCSSSDEQAPSGEEVTANDASATATELDPAAATDDLDNLDKGDAVASETPKDEVAADLGDEEIKDDMATDKVAAAKKEEADDLSDLENADFGDGKEAPIAANDTPPAPAEDPALTPPAPEPTADVASTTDTPAPDAFGAPTDDKAASTDTKGFIPVKKIKDVPFEKNGVLANTVYVARAGDDLSSVSQKIYGTDKTADLQKANPNFAAGTLKVGDKVYYNSPKRPTDNSKMLTYYEDIGAPSQSYVAKAGDNIRTVSKKLLGDQSSWKEVWATNPTVESKDVMPEGTELRYWTNDAAPGPGTDMAAANPPPPAPAQPVAAAPPPPPPPPQQVAAVPPPPTPTDPNAGLPNNVANDPNAMAGTMGEPPMKKKSMKEIASAGPDKNMKFMMLVGGVFLVGAGLLMAVRRKNARKMSINAHTQV